MKYTDYSYLWPPRPEKAIPQGLIPFYEKRGYHAQAKKNGTCTVIFAKGDRVIFKTRHNDDHKMWTPLSSHIDFFSGLSDEWNVFVAELLHSKTKHIKHHLFTFDQLVHNGEELIDTTFIQRQELLHRRWKPLSYQGDQVLVHEHVGIATSFNNGFADLFKSLKPEDEGLVFKDPNSRLRRCTKADSNGSWQVKCRVAHKNYSF